MKTILERMKENRNKFARETRRNNRSKTSRHPMGRRGNKPITSPSQENKMIKYMGIGRISSKRELYYQYTYMGGDKR